MAQQKSSRLQKLLLLLEGGSTADTRKAAAKQIVDITKTHPEQLPSVVRKVHACLYHKQWDARVAAGDAFALLAEAFPHHTGQDLLAAAGIQAPPTDHADPSPALVNFNIKTLLEKGTALLASGGQEFDIVHEPGLTFKQRMEKHRQYLKQRLGFEGQMGNLIDTDDLIKEEDVEVSSRSTAAASNKQAPADVISSMEGLSARERNRLKRKAKALSRNDSLRPGDPLRAASGRLTSLPTPGAAGSSSGGVGGPAGSSGSAVAADQAQTDEQEWADVCGGAWALQYAADQMVVDLLDPVWEVRHGAAVGLRELLRFGAGGAGIQAPVADQTSGWMMAGGSGKRHLLPLSLVDAITARTANTHWLEECVLLLLAVLALDHFADYGSDQVTAPVRETAAQALAFALTPLSYSTVMHIVTILEQLQKHSEWAVRYGGYLGVKYLMAARLDMATALLPRQLPLLTTGLQDVDDDVCAASATALIPVAQALEAMGPGPTDTIIGLIWEQLQHLDALSPASSGCLQLLACLYDSRSCCRITDQLGTLLPRLWPYLHHSLTSVRASTALCLERLLAAGRAQGVLGWVVMCGPAMMQHVFQRVLVETVDRVRDACLGVWQQLVDTLTEEQAATLAYGPAPSAPGMPSAAPATLLQVLFKLASAPGGQGLPADALLLPAGSPSSRAAAPAAGTTAVDPAAGQPAKRRRTNTKSAVVAPAGGSSGGADSSVDSEWRCLTGFVVAQNGEPEEVSLRMAGACALASLCFKLSSKDLPSAAIDHVLLALTDASASCRQLAAMTLWHWMHAADPQRPDRTAACSSPPVLTALQTPLTNPSHCRPLLPASDQPYAETTAYYTQLGREVLALIGACMAAQWLLRTPNDTPPDKLTTEEVSLLLSQVPPDAGDMVVAAQQRVESLNASLSTFEQHLHMTTLCTCSAALVRTGQLPPRLNLVIQPLMAALRKVSESRMQSLCGDAVAELLTITAARTPSPNDKLVRNICAMACGDPNDVPSAAAAAIAAAAAAETELLERQQSHGKASTSKQQPTLDNGTTADTDAAAAAVAAAAEAAAAALASVSPEAVAARIARLGAEAALAAMCKVFAESLVTRLPSLWQFISVPLSAVDALVAPAADAPTATVDQLQALIHSLQVLRIVGPKVSPALVPALQQLLPQMVTATACTNAAVRQAAARCLGSVAHAWLGQLMPALLTMLVPRLNHMDPAVRLGAVEVVVQLATEVGSHLAPYVVLLVVPLLRCMSDSSAQVRAQASRCFGSLVALVPLAQGRPLPPGLDETQLATAAKDSAFLVQLLDNKRAEDFPLPVSPSVTLRTYQQEGVNWLAFLKRFGLHGVLADDMGLGKTLQTSCIMASALVEQEAQIKVASAKGDTPRPPLPCLVVCPSTLVQHWVHEITRFLDASALRPVAVCGNPADRAKTTRQLDALWDAAAAAATGFSASAGGEAVPNVVVISYEHLKSDIAWASVRPWLYVVLDEGHMIKSHKTKIAQACRKLVASHRLILSGTPIQNSVLELWSLFDFLMPGFLGVEKDFNAKYGKALKAAKYSKKGSQEAEAGLLAVEALHKQVMPFILRRTKAQVLSDLPPKIVQDIYCDLSPLQAALYEDFQSSQASGEAATALRQAAESGGDAGSGGAVHVFQALQYMRRLCSHPAMVLDLSHPAHKAAVSKVLGGGLSEAAVQAALRQVSHAPKLQALKELLVQCGLAAGDGDEGGSAGDEDEGGGSSAGHRLLVFAQLKNMLDLVERDVLVPAGVSFLRLDGSVDASQRFGIVQRFNSDPTIDVLLLTTSVGGLGLNLTSADTVVFLEHDWNPMKDLQAMDRAHRLGQTRTVNVYRLLMRDTLEERVMGLQQFKLDVANAVVNQDNVSLGEMDTGRLLDLFEGDKKQGAEAEAAKKKAAGSGLQAMLASMGELWDEQQYEQQFNMAQFMQKLGSNKGT